MSNQVIKLTGTTLHQPVTYSTVQDAVYVRVVSYSSGGENFRVSNDNTGTDVVARYAVAPKEVLYIKKEPGQYLGGGSSNLRASKVTFDSLGG